MEKLSEFARSMNETHRICTHEISGHLHLLRFCIDELAEGDKGENPLIKKLEEGIENLEELNKLWKICTRSIDPVNDLSFEGICEKGIGLGVLYNQKFIPNISHTISGNFTVPIQKGVILVEGLYAATSILCHFAILNKVPRLDLDVKGLKSDEVNIEICGKVNKVNVLDVQKLLSSGSENEKSLRRFMGAKFVGELGGTFEYECREDVFIVRIRL